MSGVLFYNKCRIKTDVLTDIQLTEAEEKDVNFYDYDGFRLLSYTNAEALALTELPINPAINENLTFDEWNWTLAEIKTQINNVGGVVNVGAIYHTTDDNTHITCKPTNTYPTAKIYLTPTVANAVTVDWGDGSTDTWTSTGQETKSHTYTGVTDSSVYDITISCSSGTYGFSGYIAGNSNGSCIYTDIRLSNKVTSLGTYCFYGCHFLQSITIPSGITSLGNSCFFNCYSLQSITIPDTVTGLGTQCFQQCHSLQSITLPGGITNLPDKCFLDCSSLQSITLPSGVTSLGDYCFQNCNSLQSITIPNGVTSLGYQCVINCYFLQSISIPGSITNISDFCFGNCHSLQSVNISSGVTNLSNSCFRYSYCLQSITLPNSVTNINSQCFSDCYTLNKIYVKSTTPPTLDSSAIPNNTNLVIYVPNGTLAAYQNASNWSRYASKMVEYSF